jgi:Mor transcription activator family
MSILYDEKILPPNFPMDLEVCMDDLPSGLRMMAEAIGLANCLKIVDLFGGSRLIVPKRGLAPDHRLREFLSDMECQRLQYFCTGCNEIPLAKTARNVARDRQIWRDRHDGMTYRLLAAKYQLTERQILKSVTTHEKRIGKISASIGKVV